MELVRAYVTLGFKEQKSIKPDDVDRIVTRYLYSNDPLGVIAREEARRIRNEFRVQSGLRYSFEADGYVAHEEVEEIRESIRPIPQDAFVPEGMERRENGMIAPVRPEPEFGFRYEGQRPGDTPDEHLIRKSADFWLGWMVVSSVFTIIVNALVYILRAFFDTEIPFPIGFIPFLFLIFTFMKQMNKRDQLEKMKLKRALAKTDELLEDARGRGLGTTSIRR